MPESFDHDYAMKAMRARSLEQQALAMMEEQEGLGFMQAYRVAQMQRMMRTRQK